jgi:uncharacterized protein (TIGR02217 family)
MLDFIEERLELGYDFGCVGGPAFKTDIVETVGGEEQRNCNWWLPLGRWQLGERMLLDSDIEGIKEVEYLRLFHTARKGSTQGFRFKDWADYWVIGQVLGTSDGITTQWQLKKTYLAGVESFHRPITKPVEGTVIIYLDGNVVTYPLVNYETGLVSFAVPPNTGSIISCDFEFDIPVTFEKDEIEWTLEAVGLETGETLHRLGSVFVEEIRMDLPIEWYHRDISVSITEPLDLGIILDVSESIVQSSLEQSLSSGFKSKKSIQQQAKVAIKLPTIQCTQIELDKILSYFWVARGRLLNWQLQLNNKLREVRFDSDSLSIKFNASSENDRLFEVNNLVYLGILEEQVAISAPVDAVLYLPPIYLGTTESTLIDQSAWNSIVNGTSFSYNIPLNAFSFQNNQARISTSNTSNSQQQFKFNSNNFTFSCEVQILNWYNLTNKQSVLLTDESVAAQFSNWSWRINDDLQIMTFIRYFSTNLSEVFSASLPNKDYLNNFVKCKLERIGTDLNFYYQDNLIGTGNIGTNTINRLTSGTGSNATIRIGNISSSTQFNLNGYIKNILVQHPAAGSP